MVCLPVIMTRRQKPVAIPAKAFTFRYPKVIRERISPPKSSALAVISASFATMPKCTNSTDMARAIPKTQAELFAMNSTGNFRKARTLKQRNKIPSEIPLVGTPINATIPIAKMGAPIALAGKLTASSTTIPTKALARIRVIARVENSHRLKAK